MEKEEKRLFFGAEVSAPWPKEFPKGRVLDEGARHLTLAFLGEVDFSSLKQHLSTLPTPEFRVGPIGKCDKLLFLPQKHPRVVAGDVLFLSKEDLFDSFQKKLTLWLEEHKLPVDNRPFHPHITIARAPFDLNAWEKAFSPFPFFIKALHLYESMGNLTYESRWSIPPLTPFEEFEHTADIAFLIQGESMQDLHRNAELSLAWKFPPMLPYLFKPPFKNSLEEIIIDLNERVAEADMLIGTPFKAVSFHGEVKKNVQGILQWEMIVDV